MVGIFSRISGHRGSAQQRSHLFVDGNGSAVPGGEMVVLVPTISGAYAMQLGPEFKPIDHPIEPQDNDQPVECPILEPSILKDGRIWKERFAEGNRRKAELRVTKDDTTTAPHPAKTMSKRHQTVRRDSAILPSFSAQ